jgi:hypothetical protein
VLRNGARTLVLHGAQLNIAGLADSWRSKPDFDQAISITDHNAPRSCSAINQTSPAMVHRRIDLTLVGQHHGGQIKLRFLDMAVSPANLIPGFVEGFYVRGGSQLYVIRGIGTTGPLVQLNASPKFPCSTSRDL